MYYLGVCTPRCSMGKDRNEELQNMLRICYTIFTLLWSTMHFLFREKFISHLLIAEINLDHWKLGPKE
jgi:hypothetical protein